MPVVVGIQNLTGADLNITDLGLVIPASSTADLTGSMLPEQVRFSSSLATAISANQATLVDNGISMSKQFSLDFISGRPLSTENIIILGAGSNAVTSGTGFLTISGSAPVENLLINGSFRINQRQTGFIFGTTGFWNTAPGTYFLDRWISVGDSADFGIVDAYNTFYSTDVPFYAVCVLTVVTADVKFGVCQPIENKYCQKALNKKVSLQFKARQSVGTSISKVRAAILSWGGTVDNPDPFVVLDWQGVGTNPLLIGSWTYLNTPGELTPLTSSHQLYKIEGITVPSTCKNLAIMMWTDDKTTTVGDAIELTEFQLEIGDSCTEYKEREFLEDLRLCQRYFCKTMSTALAALSNMGTAGCLSVHSSSNTAGDVIAIWRFPVEMRTTPSITTFNPSASNFSWDRAGTSIGATSEYTSQHGAIISNSASSATDARHNIHACADAEL